MTNRRFFLLVCFSDLHDNLTVGILQVGVYSGVRKAYVIDKVFLLLAQTKTNPPPPFPPKHSPTKN